MLSLARNFLSKSLVAQSKILKVSMRWFCTSHVSPIFNFFYYFLHIIDVEWRICT